MSLDKSIVELIGKHLRIPLSEAEALVELYELCEKGIRSRILYDPCLGSHVPNLSEFYIDRLLLNNAQRINPNEKRNSGEENTSFILHVQRCGLETLPDSIGNLVNLHFIDLSDNPLIRLPSGFSSLSPKAINIRNTPLSPLYNSDYRIYENEGRLLATLENRGALIIC